MLLAIGVFLVLTVLATPLARRRARALRSAEDESAEGPSDSPAVPAMRGPSGEATV